MSLSVSAECDVRPMPPRGLRLLIDSSANWSAAVSACVSKVISAANRTWTITLASDVWPATPALPALAHTVTGSRWRHLPVLVTSLPGKQVLQGVAGRGGAWRGGRKGRCVWSVAVDACRSPLGPWRASQPATPTAADSITHAAELRYNCYRCSGQNFPITLQAVGSRTWIQFARVLSTDIMRIIPLGNSTYHCQSRPPVNRHFKSTVRWDFFSMQTGVRHGMVTAMARRTLLTMSGINN